MNELDLVKPEVEFQPAQVKCDFSKIDEGIAELKKKYSNWLPLESDIKYAKQVATNLNKLANALNDDKKNIKQQATKESSAFEKEAMERVNEIKAIRSNIIETLNSYELKHQEEKKAQMLEYYQTLNCSAPFEKAYNPEWIKPAVKENKWKTELELKAIELKTEYEKVQNMHVENPDLLMDLFKKTWDRLAAFDEYERRMSNYREIEERKKAAAEAAEKRKAEQAELLKQVEEKPAAAVPEPKEEIVKVNVMANISGSKQAWESAKRYMLQLGLKVEEI